MQSKSQSSCEVVSDETVALKQRVVLKWECCLFKDTYSYLFTLQTLLVCLHHQKYHKNKSIAGYCMPAEI